MSVKVDVGGGPFVWWSRGAVVVVLALAAARLSNWVTGTLSLTPVHPTWPTMTAWSALLLVLLGIGILLQSGRPPRMRARAGQAAAISAGILAAVFLTESATDTSFGLDHLLVPDTASPLQHTLHDHPSPQAAFSILMLSAAVATLSVDRRWIVTVWPLSVAAAMTLPTVALVTYLFDAAEMLSGSPALGMNAATAAAIVLLGSAAVATRPDRHPVAWLLAQRDRSLLSLLVVTFALVPVWVAVWRLIVVRFGVRGDSVWILSITLASVVLGLPSFIIFRRVQRLANDQLTQIAKRAEAERQRAEAVEQYRILAENAVDVVIHLRGREAVWVSPSIEAAFGWPVHQWLDADFVPRIHPDDLAAVFGALAENARGNAAVARFRVATSGGGYRWAEGHGKPYTDTDGHTDGVIVSVRTIDAQIAMESELEQARDAAFALVDAKSDYVSTVSHEIRSPLHAISGFAELLENRLSAEGRSEAAEWATRVRTEAERLARMIEDLLDLARLDAGKTTLASETFRLRRVVDEVVQMSKPKADAQGLHLDYSVDPAISDWRVGDADRVHQVLWNLVSNAQKFTREGRIDVEISQVTTSAAGSLIRFAVADTGPGIPGEDIERILKPFAQVSAADADRGSGLGLAISDRLVKAMGGDGLAIASLEGHGSTFHFTIPLPESQSEDRVPRNDATPVETASMKTILVVDDNQTNQLLIEIQLQKLGYHCEVASDGAQALQRLERERFDAVLMDCNMPVMDGYEATRRIRAGERGTGHHIPVLALTASASGSNRDACERAGMDGFLSKPLLMSRLAEELGHFVGAVDAGGLDSGGDCSAVSSRLPVLDHARIDRLLAELGPGPLQKVVSAFVAEMPGRLAELRRMATARDADAVRRSAHAIRSPSAMLGAAALAEQLRAVEESSDPLSDMPDSRLDELIDASVEQLQAKLSQSVNQGGTA